jgi:ubiquitin carboxyl-terminal hydrolase MINDY-1/2
MDLNPVFTSATSFRPAGDGGELKLFEQAGIKLVHGWLVDPDSPETVALTKTPDYDSAVNLIALADYTSKGQLVQDENIPGSSSAGPSTTSYTEEERERIEDGAHTPSLASISGDYRSRKR